MDSTKVSIRRHCGADILWASHTIDSLTITLEDRGVNIEFEMILALVFALPIIVNELSMGIRLIVKGFNATAGAPGLTWG